MSEDFYCEQVLSGKISVKKIIESDNVLAYYHTKPFWEIHIVVIPKKHISSLLTLEKEDELLLLELFSVIKEVAEKILNEKGAARVLTNLGKYQESKHLHFHINSGDQIRPDAKVKNNF
ncbi:MAG: HIT domain-containing protein [Pyrinomonadaceae bacterium]|nr:HIT domain-containing protein [Pyrinomonadaceae bacterium]